MAGHGRGSVNIQLEQLKTAGHHEQLTLRAVANLQNQLHDARENLHPNKLRRHDKSLEKIEQDLQDRASS
jgi:galactokinase/mevalonate kinase-like predicted kinase